MQKLKFISPFFVKLNDRTLCEKFSHFATIENILERINLYFSEYKTMLKQRDLLQNCICS